MVQRAYSVMSNDVLIAIPLFVFMGYLVERANLIEKLFKSLHLSLARVPGALAVATIVTCAIFATATGIVGAVVTLMGLLALPAMLRAGYNIKLAAGAITAGGCLGILIPPSVLLIVYGATAGVSVVKLYAGAFFPGIMLAALYVGYVIIVAKWKPHLAPPLSESERTVALPPLSQTLSARSQNALAGLFGALRTPSLPKREVATQLFVSLLPAISIVALLLVMYGAATAPTAAVDTTGLVQAGGSLAAETDQPATDSGLQEPPKEEGGLQEPPKEGGDLEDSRRAASLLERFVRSHDPAVALCCGRAGKHRASLCQDPEGMAGALSAAAPTRWQAWASIKPFNASGSIICLTVRPALPLAPLATCSWCSPGFSTEISHSDDSRHPIHNLPAMGG